MTGSVHGLVDADREVALLLDIVAATASGPGVETLAAAVARLIIAATASDVCFVHVLDDSGRSLTLAGATPPFDEYVGQVHLRLGEGVSGWVAQRREPVVITTDKAGDPRTPLNRPWHVVSQPTPPLSTELLIEHLVSHRELGWRQVGAVPGRSRAS